MTEIGRQPYLVQGYLKLLMRSPQLPLATLYFRSAYVIVYVLLLWAYIHTLLAIARRSVAVEEFEMRDVSLLSHSRELNNDQGSGRQQVFKEGES